MEFSSKEKPKEIYNELETVFCNTENFVLNMNYVKVDSIKFKFRKRLLLTRK